MQEEGRHINEPRDYNNDTRVTHDTDEDRKALAEVIQNLIEPGWGLQYASPAAKERSFQWAQQHGAHCVHCGALAIASDGTLMPQAWVDENPEMEPHCKEHEHPENRHRLPPTTPAPPI